MADRVRAAMEKMVPELEDLQNRELCTLREVKLLAKRREHHEYLIAGRAPSREDFLRYLQLEMNLEALLKLRSKTEKKAKVNAAVVAVRRRVHYIFDRSCRRFKDDEVMWLQWIEYADRTGAHTKLARVFARALALHPTKAQMWLKAAAWELEGRNNANAARKLLQRGLRLNQESVEMWVAYFRFELVFLAKAQLRQEALGLAERPVGEDEEEAGEEMEEEGEEDEEGEEEEEDGDEEKAAEAWPQAKAESDEADEADEAGLAKARLAIPLHVFEQASAALPHSPQLALECVRTCHDFDASAPLRRELLRRIRAAFGSEPAVLLSLAAMPLELARRKGRGVWGAAHSAAVRRGVEQLESATAAPSGVGGDDDDDALAAAVAGRPLLEASAVFAQGYGAWLEGLLRTAELPAPLGRQLRLKLLSVAKRAHRARTAPAALYLQWAALRLHPRAVSLRRLPPLADAAAAAHSGLAAASAASADDAARAALRVCGQGRARYPRDAALLALQLQLGVVGLGEQPTLRQLHPLLSTFEAAIESTAAAAATAAVAATAAAADGEAGTGPSVAAALWLLRLQVAMGAADAVALPEKVLAVLQRAALASRGGAGPLKEHAATWLCEQFGLERCRQLRAKLLELPPTPLEGYAPLLVQEEEADEAALASSRHAPTPPPLPQPLRSLYELALSEHAEHAPALWLRYASRCGARDDHSGGAIVYARALRALAEEHRHAFMREYAASVAELPEADEAVADGRAAKLREPPAKPAKAAKRQRKSKAQ